jgi:sugar lactone lactonase YvrE
VGDGAAATASLEVSGCPDGETAYLLTATTNVGTLYGGFCVNPASGEGTYQQQGTSGVGQVESDAGTTVVAAQGTNLELQGKLAPPYFNYFVEQQPLQASGKFSVVAPAVAHLYWANAGSGTITEANLDGSDVTQIVSGQDAPQGVAVDSSHIYWATLNNTIMEANLDGSDVIQIVSGQSFPVGVAVDSSHIYWANSIGGTIMEANLDGTGVAEIVGGQSVPFGVAVDSSHIYWASPPSGHIPSGAIWEANLDGTNVTDIVAGQSFPTGMAVDSSHIYWANFDSGTIREANLDGTNVTEIVNGQSAPTGVAVGP